MISKSFLFFFYCFSSISPVYSSPKNLSSYVRGYSFGDRKRFVKQQELLKNDFTIVSESDENSLLYKGVFLNREVFLTYFFRQDRLTSIVYRWDITEKNGQFFSKLNKLILKKYAINTNKNIKSQNEEISVYFYSLMKDKKSNLSPVDLELERFKIKKTEGEEKQIYILEFRPSDVDQAIQFKILSEDM